MDNYRGNKAAPRRNPTDTIAFNPNTTPASNQEKISGGQSRKVPISDGSNHDAGNTVRVRTNDEDTSMTGNPLQSYQKLVLPAVQNPDQGSERSTRRVAKKATDKEVL